MISRVLEPPKQSFFLFGPRGTGKTSWLKTRFPEALYIDLLESENYHQLLASPQRLAEKIPPDFKDWVVLDEVQKIPEILDEVHRLIESRKLHFVLTGSSSRKLKQKGVNLLAGRAWSERMYPFTARELGSGFNLPRALKFGTLPMSLSSEEPARFLSSYIQTYLREEVQQEGLVRNLGAFSRFLEAASFSQGSVLNMSSVSRDCSVERKVVEDYFSILYDLLIGYSIPVFTKKSKRKMLSHPKFYFFDAGVFQRLRPRGPLDSDQDLVGPAFETLVLNEFMALNAAFHLEYEVHYWRTQSKEEVDFVLYGPKGLLAFEVKATSKLRSEDFKSLELFKKDYPMAKPFMVYGGTQDTHVGSVRVLSAESFFKEALEILKG